MLPSILAGGSGSGAWDWIVTGFEFGQRVKPAMDRPFSWPLEVQDDDGRTPKPNANITSGFGLVPLCEDGGTVGRSLDDFAQ